MSRNHPQSTPWLATAILIFVAFASALTAEEATPSYELTEVIVLPSSVSFGTTGLYESLSLTVGGPGGQVTRRDAEVADSLSFDLVDDQGAYRPDGLYTYELRGSSDPEAEPILLGSGYFSIADGAFVSPDLLEDGFTKDQLISDDLIVVGSACIGQDCEEGESFGFDTLRLKENNLRIRFQDTSASGNFPSTDWMLVANDSANGGANRFSIQDSTAGTTPFTILGGASTNSLYVDAEGDVGVGTSVPAAKLHVRDGNTPGLRLEQDGSSGFTAQTWEVAGNEANFFVRDVTNGDKLPFRIRPGAPTDSLVIDADGEVGLGTLTPDARLDVDGSILLTGTVDGRDVAADGDVLDAHVADFSNPHQVTAEQVGAIGQAELDAHTGDFANPHQVTAAQTGADPAGSAAAAVAAHEAAFDHANLPSALPVPVAEGGTGATDAATARANLGVEDDPTRIGILPAAAFAGSPATATVTFEAPYPTGTTYAVLLTAVSSTAGSLLTANAIALDEAGFTVAVGGDAGDLVAVSWMVRPAAVATAVAITSPADGSSFEPAADFQVDYTLSSAGGVRAYLGGVAQLDHSGAGPITLTAPAADGSYEVRLEAIDGSGVELGASDSVSINVSASASGVSCTLGTSDVWNDGYVLNNITVTNESSEAIDAWAVVLQFAESTTIVNSWNAQLTLSGGGTILDAINTANNGTLAPGASTTFGFQGTHDGSFELPTCAGN